MDNVTYLRERSEIYFDRVNEVSRKNLNVESLSVLNDFSTFNYRLGLTNENHWNLNVDLFLRVNCEEVDMPEVTSDWITLSFVNENRLALSIDSELNEVSSTCLSVSLDELGIVDAYCLRFETVTVDYGWDSF